METELWERKLVYYGVIKNMDNSRWPKVALMDMEEDPQGSKWLMAVREVMQEVGLVFNNEGMKQWKQRVRAAVDSWNEREWESGRETSVTLVEYPKVVWGGREEYINFSKGSKMLCKFRIGDVGMRVSICEVCGEEVEELRSHILADCSRLVEERGQMSSVLAPMDTEDSPLLVMGLPVCIGSWRIVGRLSRI